MALKLSDPVDTEAGPVKSVIVSPEQAALGAVEVGAGQAAMRPLTVLAIGGLPPETRAFKELAAKLEKQTGLTALAASSAGFWTGVPAPPLEGGSSVCQLFSLGSVWYGAMGTVTYVNDGVVLAFGHSSWWTGDCGAAMAAGYVSGIWPSDWASFKMIDPRDIKGTIVQDRNWGIAGVVGQDPEMIPVTAHVTFPESGRDVTAESAAVQWAFQTTGYEDLPAYPVMYALWDACDAFFMAGSAETVTTVKVTDETGSYEVKLENVWDSYDITWDPFFDVDNAVYTLGQDPDGVLDVHLDSIDFQATVSTARRSARLVSLTLPAKGLKTGDNEIVVGYYRYGSRELQTITATLTIPTGTPVNGAFDLYPASWSGDDWYDEWEYMDSDPPATLAELVDELNAQPKNSDLLLWYEPRQPDGESEPGMPPEFPGVGEGERGPYDPIEVTIDTQHVFDGEIWGESWYVEAEAHPRRLAYNGSTQFVGMIQGATADLSVEIYKQTAGSSTETYLKTVTAVFEEGNAYFGTRVRGLKKNTTLIARVAAADGWLPGSGSASIKVARPSRPPCPSAGARPRSPRRSCPPTPSACCCSRPTGTAAGRRSACPRWSWPARPRRAWPSRAASPTRCAPSSSATSVNEPKTSAPVTFRAG